MRQFSEKWKKCAHKRCARCDLARGFDVHDLHDVHDVTFEMLVRIGVPFVCRKLAKLELGDPRRVWLTAKGEDAVRNCHPAVQKFFGESSGPDYRETNCDRFNLPRLVACRPRAKDRAFLSDPD
jgi:hypothetical protein